MLKKLFNCISFLQAQFEFTLEAVAEEVTAILSSLSG